MAEEDRTQRDEQPSIATPQDKHPVSGAVGAVAGAAAGAAVGVVGGPVGMAAGAVAGAVLGGMSGSAAGEGIDHLASEPGGGKDVPGVNEHGSKPGDTGKKPG